MNERLCFDVAETAGIARTGEPFRVGIPLARGRFAAREGDRYRAPVFGTGDMGHGPGSVSVTSRWFDGSARWILVEGTIDAAVLQRLGLFIRVRDIEAAPDAGGQSGAEISRTLSCGVRTADGTPFVATSRGGTSEKVYAARGSRRWTFHPKAQPARTVNVHLTERRMAGGGRSLFRLSVHNPAAARHRGGFWDLGDARSVMLGRVTLDVPLARRGEALLYDARADTMRSIERSASVSVRQFRSGQPDAEAIRTTGIERTHRDPGREPSSEDGASDSRIRIGSESTDLGRLEPVLRVTDTDHSLGMTVPHFWESSPIGFDLVDDAVHWHLLCPRDGDAEELQPGERKSWDLLLDTSGADPRVLGAPPLVARPDVDTLRDSGAMPGFDARPFPPLRHLLQVGLEPERGFAAKRERAHVYGWRDFGELHADHETLYQAPGDRPFVSHYNNQYDPILGFGLQFLESFDCRHWWAMDELARHVRDIDVYRTDDDRVEYNHGLFWHTNHYVDAATSTHRTFSVLNRDAPGSNDGGGPGAQHCYTTGLALHYWLTGDTDSRATVLELAGWMIALHEARVGLLHQMQQVVRQDLRPLIAHLHGDRSRFVGEYPLTRGTGNYLNTLIDAWQIDGTPGYLRQAERVVSRTAWPDEDIDRRDLGNVERNWSYTVYLQALGRFLCSTKGACDTRVHAHGVATLLHFSHWMLEHDGPYLDSPDRLEFVNDTWAAQDLRKCNVLLVAAEYDPAERRRLHAAAKRYLDHVLDVLGSSETLHFTRIQAILMQNYGLQSRLLTTSPDTVPPPPPVERTTLPPPTDSAPALLARAIRRILRGLWGLRPLEELHWLRTRL